MDEDDNAIYWLAEAIKVNPSCHLAYIHMAKTLLKTGDFKAAVNSAHRAISISPLNQEY